MLLYAEDILLFISLAVCAVLILFMIKKMYNLIESLGNDNRHIVTKTVIGKRGAKKENSSLPVKQGGISSCSRKQPERS